MNEFKQQIFNDYFIKIKDSSDDIRCIPLYEIRELKIIDYRGTYLNPNLIEYAISIYTYNNSIEYKRFYFNLENQTKEEISKILEDELEKLKNEINMKLTKIDRKIKEI